MTSTVPAVGTLTAQGSALQAVLLDMDGTLVDTEGFWWDVEVEVFSSLGHTLDDAWRHVVVGGPMTRSAGFLIEATGADIGLDELTVLLNDAFESRIDHALPLMPGAARLLDELAEHEIPTALVSASHRRIIDRVLPVLGAEYFALSVAGDEVPRTKPHPDPPTRGGRRTRRRPRALRGRRGHGHRRHRRRGRRLPGRRGALGGPDHPRRPAHGRPVARRRGPAVPARSDDRPALTVHAVCTAVGTGMRGAPSRGRSVRAVRMRFRPRVAECVESPKPLSHVIFTTFTRVDNDVRACIPPDSGDHRRAHVSRLVGSCTNPSPVIPVGPFTPGSTA